MLGQVLELAAEHVVGVDVQRVAAVNHRQVFPQGNELAGKLRLQRDGGRVRRFRGTQDEGVSGR